MTALSVRLTVFEWVGKLGLVTLNAHGQVTAKINEAFQSSLCQLLGMGRERAFPASSHRGLQIILTGYRL